MSSNPFAALLSASKERQDKIAEGSCSDVIDKKDDVDLDKKKINDIIEHVFGFTINEKTTTPLVFLDDFTSTQTQQYLTIELLNTVLFERLSLDDPEEYVRPINKHIDSQYLDKKVLIYLLHCFNRIRKYNCDEGLKNDIKKRIIQNAVLAVQQPIVFLEQDAQSQFIDIMKDFEVECNEYFDEIATNFSTEDGTPFDLVFIPILNKIHIEISRSSLLGIDQFVFRSLEIFTVNDKFAGVLLLYCTPSDPTVGLNYANTLFGALFSISILPKSFNQRYEYFDSPMDMTTNIVENNLWHCTSNLTEKIHHIFMRLLRLKESKNKTLTWLSQCIKANSNRGKLWNTHMLNPMSMTSVGDGFIINLVTLLLRLCQPFCANISDQKILKVDPTYCAVPEASRESKNVNMLGLSDETCLIPAESNEIRLTSDNYSFVTECFYLTHKTLDISFRVCVDQLIQLNQELSQIQRSYNDFLQQGVGSSNDILETIRTRMEDGFKKYRSIRATLIEPNFLELMSQFHKATTTWLVQVTLHQTEGNEKTFSPLKFKKVTFPLPSTIPDTLKCIPEFVVENTVGYLSFLRRFHPQTLEDQGFEFLSPILSMVLTFMGSPERMRNPHLRARMAECLEGLLPEIRDMPAHVNPVSRFQRESLFNSHPHRKYIVENLLNVFVSIEMTGQSVQFEQKFNYRRPMYIVMDYLWTLEEHKDRFKELAKEAEESMDAVTPPLFLRFVNLLMNDAVFLLDESLANMAQIRTMQTARENGEWNNLPAEERTQNLSYINHLGMIARFDNILGRETIHTLELLTSEISTVFTHSTMVDRVAAMLNYFLYNLVGPNKKNFKVKDQREYEFDPANTVLNICKIYVHLYESNSFCLAISQDGRSYSPQLFTLAEDVLARIGGGVLISELQEVAQKVSRLASQNQREEEILGDAPEEFLDPIMSTLMSDPVILPSSKQIVDRTTIARHILSDQTDPFNRSPLTMDQLIPASELQQKIKEWIEEKKKQKGME